MSRALTIDASQDDIAAACAKHSASISAIETLPGGCVRVVLSTGDGAALIRKAFAKAIVTTPQARTPLALAARGVPLTSSAQPEHASAPLRIGKR